MTTPLRGALYNCLRDRNPERVVAFVRKACAEHDLDFILLSEAQDYLRQLADIPGYRLINPHDPNARGDEQNPILVRDTLTVQGAVVKQMSRKGWFTRSGKAHAPAYATVARIDGWLRVMSAHAPVSVNWRPNDKKARPYGPRARVKAYTDHSKVALRWAEGGEPGTRTVLGADWNANIHRGEIGKYSPSWIAREAGMQVVIPTPHHSPLGHNGLDYLVTDARISECRKQPHNGGSDHPFVTFNVSL